jgi:hypothetical protein
MTMKRVVGVSLAVTVMASTLLGSGQGPDRAGQYAFLSKSLALPSKAGFFEFHSDFWINLHHFLYHLARPKGPVPRSPVVEPIGPLTEEERRSWGRAIDFYRKNMVAKSLLFDDQMGAIKQELAVSENAAALSSATLGPELADLLNGVAPIYHKYWWPAHDAANRLWIISLEPLINTLGPRLFDQLANAYEAHWYPGVLRVDVTAAVGTTTVAYTTGTTHGHVVISSTDPCDQGYMALQTIAHEASHTIVDEGTGVVGEAIERAAKDRNVSAPETLWHALMLYTDGELVRRELAELGIGYNPDEGLCNVFTRGWEQYRDALDLFWRMHLDGNLSLEAAVSRMVDALTLSNKSPVEK